MDAGMRPPLSPATPVFIKMALQFSLTIVCNSLKIRHKSKFKLIEFCFYLFFFLGVYVKFYFEKRAVGSHMDWYVPFLWGWVLSSRPGLLSLWTGGNQSALGRQGPSVYLWNIPAKFKPVDGWCQGARLPFVSHPWLSVPDV